MCTVPQTDMKLDIPSLSISLVDVKGPVVSVAKSWWAVTGILAKFQICALTYRWHCISDTAALLAMMQHLIQESRLMKEINDKEQ